MSDASATQMLSVILPASNEEGWIGACLAALFASDPPGIAAEVIVVANGCRDATAEVARGAAGAAMAAGWSLSVIERAEPGKPGALNAGDAVARGTIRAYLDADVTVSPPLMHQIVKVLAARSGPAYATGRPQIAAARSAVTRAYARIWARLPFFLSRAPGFGLFAVNAAGRTRWGEFPPIIADDTFVRLQFTPDERDEVPASYSWPMVEGFGALVRVRRRQDAGGTEIARLYPDALSNEAKPRLGATALARLAISDPPGLACYAAVSIAVRAGRGGGAGWARGR